MTRWKDQFSIFYGIGHENLANTDHKNHHSWFKMLPNTNRHSKNKPNIYNFLPKLRNYAKSGRTVTEASRRSEEHLRNFLLYKNRLCDNKCWWSLPPSVTRWPYYFFNIWPLTAKKFAQLHEKFIKLGATFCPNRPFKFAKVAKLRQIWSHCLRPMKYLLVSKIWVNFATKCDCKNNQINILVHFISAHLSGCAKFWTYGKV